MERCKYCNEIIQYIEDREKWAAMFPIMKQFAFICNGGNKGHEPK